MDDEEFWSEFYEVDSTDEWVNGGYDERGEQVWCACGGEMHFDDDQKIWICRDCGYWRNRAQWFDFIEASPPGKKCLSQCKENYPICKKWCMIYDIPLDDPII